LFGFFFRLLGLFFSHGFGGFLHRLRRFFGFLRLLGILLFLLLLRFKVDLAQDLYSFEFLTAFDLGGLGFFLGDQFLGAQVLDHNALFLLHSLLRQLGFRFNDYVIAMFGSYGEARSLSFFSGGSSKFLGQQVELFRRKLSVRIVLNGKSFLLKKIQYGVVTNIEL